MSREVTVTVTGTQEATRAPWWLIIDPSQMMRLDVHHVASMITGPFFSREEATRHLECRRHAFSKHARVYCHSGYASLQWDEAMGDYDWDGPNGNDGKDHD